MQLSGSVPDQYVQGFETHRFHWAQWHIPVTLTLKSQKDCREFDASQAAQVDLIPGTLIKDSCSPPNPVLCPPAFDPPVPTPSS